ncbi:MAG TPA: NADPH:quinone oxidoreductase family protein [Candidatus Dormibacteraeota bacterium]|jgi:NADPH2:quinone reductase
MTLEQIVEGSPAEDRIRVRIEAVGVNFFEGLLIQGRYQVRPELPFVPGAEGAGVVEACPTQGRIRRGQRVAFLADIGRGTYAEMADIPPTVVVPIPDLMPSEEAAGLLTTYLTAHLGLHRRAQLQRGETLLVHAGAGGVGSAAIQLGKAAGARVIATAGTDEKVAFCLSLGADAALNYRDQDFVAAVKELTGGRGADVILDPVGGDVFDRSTKCIAFEGRIVVVGFTSGRIAQAATNHALLKSYSIVGVHVNLQLQRTPDLVMTVAQELLNLYRQGAIKPQITARYPLTEAPRALRAVMSGQTQGKTVLTLTKTE